MFFGFSTKIKRLLSSINSRKVFEGLDGT